jgi:hypothetical protein
MVSITFLLAFSQHLESLKHGCQSLDAEMKEVAALEVLERSRQRYFDHRSCFGWKEGSLNRSAGNHRNCQLGSHVIYFVIIFEQFFCLTIQ